MGTLETRETVSEGPDVHDRSLRSGNGGGQENTGHSGTQQLSFSSIW